MIAQTNKIITDGCLKCMIDNKGLMATIGKYFYELLLTCIFHRLAEIHNGEPTIRLFGGGFREAVKQSLQGEVILSSIITRSLAQHDDCIPEISLFYTTKNIVQLI